MKRQPGLSRKTVRGDTKSVRKKRRKDQKKKRERERKAAQEHQAQVEQLMSAAISLERSFGESAENFGGKNQISGLKLLISEDEEFKLGCWDLRALIFFSINVGGKKDAGV